jgi:uncharacterized protein YlzI (FlbEa/FlbD family)
MLLYFKDFVHGSMVALNGKYVVAVFTVSEGEYVGKTGITLINGNLIVEDSHDEVVAKLQLHGGM